MKNNPKNLFQLCVLLTLVSFTLSSQTFVTVYSENFETVADGTPIIDIDFSYYGQGASVPTVSESIGNGSAGSNRFITTTDLQDLLGIVKYLDLTANKQYKFSNAVKRTIGLTSNPIRITRPSGNGNYHNQGTTVGTGDWQIFNVNFTAVADENVQFVTVKQADGGIISLDNIKLQVEGISWTGAVSTNWHDAGNWEGGAVPTTDDSVLIANVSNQPIINDQEVRIKNLEIADGVRLLVQNNKPLIVNGQLTGDTGYVELLAGSTLFADRIVGDNHIISEVGAFSVNSVFQSHMVLQRQQPIPIYGAASDGLTVSVTLDGETKTTTASGGKWEVIFDAKEAGGSALNLSISGTDSYEFTDILMGDVWVCGGQSNMAQNVSIYQSFPEFENVPGTYQNNQIRLMTVKVYESTSPQDEVQIQNDWVDANPTSISAFSATGYFFGKYLQPEINVPLGLITVARGGTGMASFMSLEAYNSNEFAKDNYNFEEIGLTAPSTLYNSMVYPLTKQAVKGVIWYQGENEANLGNLQPHFSSIFTTLINSWRSSWNQNDLPFLFNQLSAWGNVVNSPTESKSATVRQQQLDTWKNVVNTGMTVSIDGGITDDIHPPNKEDVGSRLALVARKLAYGEDITYSGPTIREVVRVNNTDKAIVKFKNFGAGLESRAITLNIHGPEQYNLLADSIYGFELAGLDKVFYRAKAKIENDSIITVTNQNVSEPAWVRFGWANFPLTNLYNDAGLLASPFETQISLVESDNSLSNIVTINDIPGRAASDHYTCRIKFENEPDTAWRDVFVLQTRGKETAEDPEGAYYDIIRGFTASWISFESDFSGDAVVVEISKKDGSPISQAMVRPKDDATPAVINNGKAYVKFTEPANVNVDINGQMEDNYTGFGSNGAKVHTISLFANPIFTKPDINDPSVKVLQPDEDINTLDRATWQTIVFAPGVHNIGMGFKILSNETLYIPGDAVVHGTIHPLAEFGPAASKNFKVYGSGTISGENIVRNPSDNNKIYKPFTYQAEGAHLEGFVVADPAFHTFNMGHTGDASNINIYKNLKVLAWRINSDGINAFKNSEVSECFFRVQDDAFYYGQENVNQHDNVVWNDANGAVLFLQDIADGSTNTFRDVKVIYHRSQWHWWDGGRIVSMRSRPTGVAISNVHVQNILVEDPLPAFPPFYATMVDDPGGVNINMNNIIFENIHQEHDGVSSSSDGTRGKPQNKMIGVPSQVWENIWFKDCYFNGKTLTSFEDGNFDTEFVDPNTVIFEVTNPAPTADFSSSATSIVVGESIDFTDLSTNTPTSWSWTFDDGTPATSTTQNPSVSYSNPGSYNVTLVASNSFGSHSITKTAYISVSNTIPVTAVTIDNCPTADLGPGSTYQLTATVTPMEATDKSISWTSSNTSIATVDTNGLVSTLASGTATITSTTNDGGFTSDCIINVSSVCTDDLPWSDANFTVSNKTANYSSGAIDISCTTSATISLDIEGMVKRSDGTNYCNVYYRVDGGALQSLSQNTGSFSLKTVSTSGIAGNTLEIIIDCKSSHPRNDYFISNLSVTDGQTASKAIVSKDIKPQDLNELKIYPNPVENILNIDFGNQSPRSIRLFNIIGKLLYNTETSNSTVQIDMKKLKISGPVFVQIQSEASISYHKIIVR